MVDLYQLIIATVLLVSVLLLRWKKRATVYPYPPGPPADPLIGHVRILPSTNQEKKFQEWGKEYGDVIYLSVLGKPLVVLNNMESALDLLEKRGAMYSLRPPFPVLFLMGFEWALSLLSNTDQLWINHRRLFQKYFAKHESTMSTFYREAQTAAARVLIQDLGECASGERKMSAGWDFCFRKFSVSIITQISYGYQIKENDDWYLKLSEVAMKSIEDSGPVGNTIVDQFPFLQHFPSWFPGTYYANHARKCRPSVDKLLNEPVERMRNATAEDTIATKSIVYTELSELERTEMEDSQRERELYEVKALGGIIYVAGGDTTEASMGIFLLAMVLHSEVQAKAKQELVRVVGGERLPTIEDRQHMPYLEALVWEVLRWYPVVPLGVPHKSTQDDVYKGMYIPKGSIVIANAWAINQDERIYHDPSTFKPERFLVPRCEPYPTAAFGFGRRICPGRFFAEQSIWLGIAYVLSVFDISAPLGPDGKELKPQPEYTNGLINHVKAFPCRLSVRRGREKLLEAETI